MSSASASPTERSPRQPEKKIGPFAGGVGVAIWLNEADDGKGGTRKFRTITVAPRRYRDEKSQQWKDSSSYNPADLPALVFALQQAQAYCYETPLPGDAAESHDEVPY